ncbi:hypothetical protein GF325_14450, partial [Candidatus Bathyarchaeota archaeon]|nr:hypothetical protein [Candidatus Bathyarchaeota archaeon]
WCTAEYIWEVADKHGIPAFIMNYPAGWPATLENGSMSLFTWRVPESKHAVMASPATHGFTMAHLESNDDQDGHPIGTMHAVSIPPSNLPASLDSKKPIFMAHLNLIPSKVGNEVKGIPVKAFFWPSNPDREDGDDTGTIVMLEITDGTGKSCDFIPIRKSWSDWIVHFASTDHGTVEVMFKARLHDLATNESTCTIDISTIYRTRGWTSPGELGRELIKHAFPIDLHLDDHEVEFMFEGAMQPYIDRARTETRGIVNAIEHVKETAGWQLCMFHVHFLDSLNHKLLAKLHVDSPVHSERAAVEALDYIRKAYTIVDEMMQALLDRCVDDNTNIILVADHGAIPSWKVANIPAALERAGLLAYKEPDHHGYRAIDWSRTRAFPYLEPPYIWVNLEGRDPTGIVSPADLAATCDEIIECLREMRDPETRKRVVRAAFTREEAAVLHQDGPRVGDVVYLLDPPYQLFDGRLDGLDPSLWPGDLHDAPLAYQATTCFGAHAYYLPTARVGEYSVSSPFIARGPAFKEGVRLEYPVNLLDLAPTIAHLLHIPPPAQAKGRILREILR